MKHKILELPLTGSLNPVPKLKASMRKALKQSALSREQVVEEMNRLASLEGLTTGGRSQKITLALLEKWVAGSAQNQVIPLKFLPIFCKVMGDITPLIVLAKCLGCEVILEEDQKLLLWAKIEREKRRAAKRARKLAEELGI